MNDQAPTATVEAIFNIGAVTRMTGIPITTLHAWERAARTTLAPSRAKSVAMAFPSPRLAPVTTATLPFSKFMKKHSFWPAQRPVDIPQPGNERLKLDNLCHYYTNSYIFCQCLMINILTKQVQVGNIGFLTEGMLVI